MLKSRLANARVKLKGLREGLAGTRAEARTATIYLSLTTEKIEPGAVGGGPLDNIKDVLAWEAIGLLYFLVVAGPFILRRLPRLARTAPAAQAGRHPPARAELVNRSGSSARTVVPRPGSLETSSSASERFHPVGQPSKPRSPTGSAPPTPSSETSTTSRPSSRTSSTCARLAEAYLATFVSDSETT